MASGQIRIGYPGTQVMDMVITDITCKPLNKSWEFQKGTS